MMMIWALLRVRIVAIWHHDHHFVRLFLLSSSGSRIRGVPRRFVRARPNVVVVVSKRKKMNHVAKWEMIIKKSVLSSSIERTRERERKRWSQRGEFPRLWEKSQFLRSKTPVVSQIYVDNSPTFSSSSSHQSLVLLRSRSLVLRYRSIRRLLSSISYSSWTSVPLGRLFLRFRHASSSLYLSLSKIVFLLSALYYPQRTERWFDECRF